MRSNFRLSNAASIFSNVQVRLRLQGRTFVNSSKPKNEFTRKIMRAYHGNRVICMSDPKDKASISTSEDRVKGLVDRIFDFLGITNTTFTYPTAKTLLNNCQLASQNKVWYSDKRGRIGKDFRSQHTILLLHVKTMNSLLLGA